MKQKKIVFSFIVLLFAALSGFLFTSRAQKANTGLSVHPSNIDLTTNPGQTTTQDIYLDNLTDQSITIGVDKKNFTAQGEEGSVSLTDDTTTYSLASWITITPAKTIIEPHKSQKFTYTITVPANAEPGGHFGSLVFKTIPNANLNGSGAVLSQQVGSLILLKIPGNIAENATVQSFSTDKQFYEFGPAQFDLRVKNNSDVHIQPIGTIVVTGLLGQRFEVQIDPRNILPHAIRKISATLEKKLLFGPYTATLIVSYGDKNQSLYGSTTFYAFPVRYGLIAFGVLIILFFLRKRLWKAAKAIATGK
ncbi:MAG TPA: DUF916 domain-containing protein [Candidatus Saccharimonadales bacterium]|nr:DUF916 domain-containing protein [Candidatus Saccharimonadales bacterium]